MRTDNDLYRVLFEAANHPMLIMVDRQIVDANSLALGMFDLTREELNEKELADLLPDAQPGGINSTDFIQEQIEASSGDWQAESFWTYLAPKGDTFTANTTLRRFNIDGNPYFQLAIKKEANGSQIEHTRGKGEKWYRDILKSIGSGYYEVDLEGNFIFFDETVENLFGYGTNDLLGQNYRLIMDDDIADEIFLAFNNVLKTGIPVKEISWPIIKKNETITHVEASIILIKDDDKNPVGFRGIVRDITQRVNAEEALRRSEERYRTIIENVQDGYYEVDLAGNHTFVNEALCNMYLYSEEELLNMSYKDYMDKENAHKVFKVFHNVYLTREPVQSFDYQIFKKDGSNCVVQTSITLMMNSEDEPIGFRGVVRDITERKEAEDLLKEAHDKLEHRVRERTAELGKANAELKEEINERKQAEKKIEKSYQSQEVLTALLRLSLEEIPLDEQLERAFDTIISIPWLSTLPKGSIFIVEDESDTLELKVQRGLAPQLLEKCARVPFGKCLCGRAAETGKTVFASCLDGRHEHTYEGIAEHGHYNVPIFLDDKIVGVINLYLEENHQQDDNEIAFLETAANTLASLIKQARIEEKVNRLLDHRGRQVQLSTQVAQEIAAATDLEDLYHRVVTQVKEQFNYYHAQLLRYDPALDTVALVVGYGEVGEKMLAMHHSVPMGAGQIGIVASTGQSLLYPDVTQNPTWQPNPLLHHTKGELTVPIKLGEEVLGVLDVQSDVINALNEEDQLLLEGLCGQIAVAIESTRLQQEMEIQLHELNTLHRYMSREGWEKFQAKKLGLLGYQFGHMGTQPILSENGKVNDSPPKPANGKVDLIPLANEPGSIVNPLKVRGEIVGKLGIVDDVENPLTEEEQQLLNAITEQVAEALEVARLFEQTEESLAEQERLASELEAVAQVSTAASTLLSIDTLLQSVVDLAKSSFNLYHAQVYLVDADKEKLVLRAGAGNVGRLMVLEGDEIDFDSGSNVSKVVRDQQSYFVNDVQKTVDYKPHSLLPNTRSQMIVPMIVGDSLIGVLDLQADEIDFFTTEDIKIQKTLAAQIAVAVQNAFLYEEQVETASKLRQVDQLKSEFLASMSHELRTPLNSIIGFSDVLLEGLDGDLNERMEEDIRLIRDSGDHLRTLIGDILDMSKIEAGRMELRYETINLRQIANEIIATTSTLAQAKSLEMYLDIGPDVDTIEADRTRLRQIFLNIVGNAIKFTEKGYVNLSMQIKDNNLLVTVRDTGVGIKPEHVPIVFEQFRQIDGSLNRSVGGTGLGMPITKNLVELHGGKIWVESVFGHGSTFYFTIPLQKKNLKRETSPLPKIEERS